MKHVCPLMETVALEPTLGDVGHKAGESGAFTLWGEFALHRTGDGHLTWEV